MITDATRTSIGTGKILPENTLLSDRYRIVRLLGIGAMGMVYLARDERLELDVALKVLRSGGSASDVRLERFRSELMLARQISHRNVVRIHDLGESGDMHFISMDYVDGESLKYVLEKNGAMDVDRASAIAADLAEAIAEAHRAGIVHRDIKPANVLIGSDRAFLTDFGVARLMHSDGPTRTGEFVGTLDYLSPEQARGAEVDGRADIYALGLLLYEMIAGTRPFSGETAEEILAQRTLARPPDFVAGGRRVPKAMRRIIRRCLAVDPDQRYQTAGSLAADLRSDPAGRRWRLPRVKSYMVALATTVALAAGLAWHPWYVEIESAVGSPTSATRPMAVLPFELTVQSGELNGIGHALADQLTEQLSQSPALQLITSQRVYTTLQDLQLQGSPLPASDRALLGDLLDADYLIEVRVHAIDNYYRLEARVRSTSSDELLHQTAVDVDGSSQLFDAIEVLSGQLLGAIAGRKARVTDTLPDASWEAMSNYALGVERMLQGNVLQAIDPLRSAVRIDPDFALAWDRLSQALAIVGRDREAMAAADRAVAALGDNGSRDATLVRARRAALAGKLETAAAALTALLKWYPDDTSLQFRLAEIYGEGGNLADAQQALLRVVQNSPNHAQAWYLLGKFSILSGNARRAADEYLVKALVIQNRLGNSQGRADVLNALGIAHAQLGNSERAAEYYGQALDLRREIGDAHGVAAVLGNLARISLEQQRYEEGRKGLIEARDTLQKIGDRWTVANLENELGFLEEQRGRFGTALSHYRTALRLRDELGDMRAMAESYNNVGYAYFLLGEYDNAQVFIDRSLRTYHDIDNSEGVMLASQTRGILDIARGEYADALEALLRSLQLSRDLNDPQAEAIAEGYIGRARHLQGQYASASAAFDNALSKLETIGDSRGLAEFILRDAQLALDTGMWDAAAGDIERARELLKDDANSARHSLQLRIEGAYLDAVNRPQLAAARMTEALAAARRSGEKPAILFARLGLAGRRASVDEADTMVADLQAIHDKGRQIGHGELQYASGMLLGKAYLAAGRLADAEAVLREALQPFRLNEGLHGEFRLQMVLADVLLAQGRSKEAEVEWRAAAAGVMRAMNAQTEQQRNAFSELPAVRRILGHEDIDYEGNPDALAVRLVSGK